MLLVGALLIDAWLGWLALTEGALAGCGGEEGCRSVLATLWAYSFHIPVSLLALVTHAALLALTFSKLEKPVQRLLFGALGWGILLAAVWFVAIQAKVLEQYCVFCMTAHGLGVLAVVILLRDEQRKAFLDWRSLLLGCLGLAILIGGQVLFIKEPIDVHTVINEAPAPELGDELVNLQGGLNAIDPETFPHLGNPTAGRVLALLYDYTCGHCRETYQSLYQFMEGHADDVCLIVLPIPSESACNPYIAPDVPQHEDSCEYVRLSIVLFLTDRALFHEFNDVFLLKGKAAPPFAEARAWAEAKLVDAPPLLDLMYANEVTGAMQFNLDIFAASSEMSGRLAMPKIITEGVVISGAPSELSTFEKHLDPKTGNWWTGQ